MIFCCCLSAVADRTLVLQQLCSALISGQFKRSQQENIFPCPNDSVRRAFSFVDPVCEVSVKRHIKSLVKIRKSVLNPEFCWTQLHTAGLLFIQNRKLLLAFSNNKQCFYL